MALTNYNELQTAVKAWAARADLNFGGNVPDFIRLAEERIWKNLRCSDMVSEPSTLTIPAGLNYVALPADWLGFVRFKQTNGQDMNYQPIGALDNLLAGGNVGDASIYSIEGRYLYYGQAGAVGTGTVLPMTYYKHPGLLSAVSTTWLLTKYPTAYLMGALWAGCVFLKNGAKAAEYEAMMLAALDGIISQDKAAMLSGGRLQRRGPGLT